MAAVLFDLDGTLHDRLRGLRAFASQQALALGLARDARERFVGRFLELDANGRVWKDRVYARLRLEFESSGWPSTALLVEEYLAAFPRFATEVPGAAALLRSLGRRHVKLAIVTNGRSDLQRSVIQSLGFGPLVNAIIVSEEVGWRKPQREIYEIALASVAADPGEAIMVGDDPVADVEGARKTGLFPIAFRCESMHASAFAGDMKEVRREIFRRVRALGARH